MSTPIKPFIQPFVVLFIAITPNMVLLMIWIFLTKPVSKDYNDYKLELAFYKQPVFIKNAYQLGEQRANGYHAFLNRNLDIPLYQRLYRYFKENMHQGRIQKE